MHVRRALGLAFVVPLLLAGCTDEPEPAPKMPEPTSSSPTPSPRESETPEAESAEDFVRRWQSTSDEMQVTGDASTYLGISSKCASCKDLAANVKDIYGSGGRIEFAGSEIRDLKRVGAQPPTYDVDLALAKTVIYRGSESEPQVLPAGQMRIRVTLKQVQGDWTVTHYGVP